MIKIGAIISIINTWYKWNNSKHALKNTDVLYIFSFTPFYTWDTLLISSILGQCIIQIILLFIITHECRILFKVEMALYKDGESRKWNLAPPTSRLNLYFKIIHATWMQDRRVYRFCGFVSRIIYLFISCPNIPSVGYGLQLRNK